jgi:hypothetical protein
MERHPRLPRPVRLGRLSIDLVIFAPVFLAAVALAIISTPFWVALIWPHQSSPSLS